jgi:NRPS condensation-like uncharacterized protein
VTGSAATGPVRAGAVAAEQAENGGLAAEDRQPGPPAAGPGRPARARFAVPDELTCYYDRPAEPANVHLEVLVPDRLDEADLRTAVRAVLDAEPGLRVRQAPGSRLRSGYFWEFSGATDIEPVLTATYRCEAELADLRSDLLSRSLPLGAAPPFRFLLASGPGGDALMLSAHHARFDGLSCLRLVRSVADRYSARVGLLGGGDRACVPAHEAPASAQAGSAARATPTAPRPAARPGRITKIARQPEPGPAAARLGYGAHHVAWDGLAAANRLRSDGVSVNDVLIAAMMLTIAGWNQANGARSGLIAITMPVGDRAQAGAGGQWTNTSRLTTVTARLGSPVAAGELLADVAAQTRYAKDHASGQVDPFSRALVAAPVPVALKLRMLRTGLAIAGPYLCHSSLVSNLGVIEPIRFRAAAATELWFSTFAHMPRGLAVGAATVSGRLHLTFRYRRALLTGAAAASFAARYCQALDQITGRDGTP